MHPVAPRLGSLTLLVTRPQRQAVHWVQRLREAGLAAEALPLLSIGPAPDPQAVQRVHRSLVAGGVVMFVSPNAALQYMACLPPAASWPAGVWAAATGPGTVRALCAAGVPASCIVSPPAEAAQFDSEALWAALARQPGLDWRGRQVWVVRGEGGRDWFAQTAQSAGAEVHFVQSYQRAAPVWSPAEQSLLGRALAQPAHWCWLLSSSEALGHLVHGLPAGMAADWTQHQALVTHPRIAERAQALGWGRLQMVAPTVDAVLAALRGAPPDERSAAAGPAPAAPA